MRRGYVVVVVVVVVAACMTGLVTGWAQYQLTFDCCTGGPGGL